LRDKENVTLNDTQHVTLYDKENVAPHALPASATFFAEPPFVVGAHTVLGETEAHHIRVRRLAVGERVALCDGQGHTASGQLVRIQKSQALVEVNETADVAPAPPIHLLVPVADRDRMLWLAEKAAELNVASWRPVLWHRSKSVSPRGEGRTFQTKVRARMISAMLQSRSAWLPEIFPEATPDRAVAATTAGQRYVFDATGLPIAKTAPFASPVSLAIGPEGGFEPAELEQLVCAGFTLSTLGPSILRFETAAVAAVAVARSLLIASSIVGG
jgi:16S rRNA (uracil1498-N3)-methyltransferase